MSKNIKVTGNIYHQIQPIYRSLLWTYKKINGSSGSIIQTVSAFYEYEFTSLRIFKSRIVKNENILLLVY